MSLSRSALAIGFAMHAVPLPARVEVAKEQHAAHRHMPASPWSDGYLGLLLKCRKPLLMQLLPTTTPAPSSGGLMILHGWGVVRCPWTTMNPHLVNIHDMRSIFGGLNYILAHSCLDSPLKGMLSIAQALLAQSTWRNNSLMRHA